MTDDERQLLLDTAYIAVKMLEMDLHRYHAAPQDLRDKIAYIDKIRIFGARVQATVDKAKEAE